jgi:3-hydroxyacyl-[acyl-carrier-protein] dehydratase
MRFRLVDRILGLEPGKSIRAVKQLPASEELFRDHFPGFPVVPGVLLTEMMAQAAGKCLDAAGSHSGRAMLAEIRTARFREWVRPDEDVVIHAEITQDRTGYAMARCRLEVGGKKVGSAELMFAFLPYDRFSPEYRDEVLEAYLAGDAGDR